MMAELTIGDAAPAFTLDDQNGKPVSLAALKGQPVFIYFYPKPSTPGCTTQSCAVRDALPEIKSNLVTALGISVCEPPAQAKFDAKYGFGFPLLSDPDHAVCEAYDVWREKSMYGKTYMGVLRSAFLIDPDGRIAGAWYKVSPADTVPSLMAALE
jgi:peroxiredoxin Q/BCP